MPGKVAFVIYLLCVYEQDARTSVGNLLWGVRAFFYDKFTSTDDTIDDINKICKEKKYVQKGDMVINLASMPIANKGMVNTLRISDIE